MEIDNTNLDMEQSADQYDAFLEGWGDDVAPVTESEADQPAEETESEAEVTEETEVAEAESGSAEVFQAAVDGLGRAVAGAGSVEVGEHVGRSFGQGSTQRGDLG